MSDGLEDATARPTFRATPRAIAEAASIAAREGKPGARLRVAVEAGGCSGFQYRFELDEAALAPDDLLVADRVVVDATSLDLLAGSELDWTNALIGAHFAITNPLATSGCGCGASFSVG
ncbi:HesB/IscA family protein [Humitalea sp. 24SJ18S-53]|uniref:HesB/IscA family protein n=1 Tax=Humitalea sp. 24SJ18S-53 TaxID=3422307 RepID=UPI003D676E53